MMEGIIALRSEGTEHFFGKEKMAFFSKFLYNWVFKLIFFPVSTLASLEFREINVILRQFINISHALILSFHAY